MQVETGPRTRGSPATRRVTASDVARAAGVSRTTVSYVLNDRSPQSIPEATRQRVKATAAQLGYAPSAAARTLATGRSTLALGLLADWPVGDNVGQIFRRLTEAFARRGFVFLTHTASQARDTTAGADLLWRTVSPAAVLIFDDISDEQVTRMRAAGVAVVSVLLSASGQGRGGLETWDEHAGQVQLRHLLSRGHRRIGYAWPDDSRLRAFAIPRLRGVSAGCAEAGVDPPDVRTVPLTLEGAVAAITKWRRLSPPVTAVCAYNDEVAIALLGGLRHLGLTPGEDIAVIGADDLPIADLTDPPLSTVNYDRRGMAEFLASAVVDAVTKGGGEIPLPDFAAYLRVVHRGTS